MTCDLEELKTLVVRKENARIAAGDTGTYGGLKSVRMIQQPNNPTPKTSKAKNCKYYASGNCKAGDRCPFNHDKTVRVVTSPPPSSDGGTRDLKYLREKCRRPQCSSSPEHPFFACKHPSLRCLFCKEKGHTVDLCPKKQCRECKQQHSTRVHGWSTTEVFH